MRPAASPSRRTWSRGRVGADLCVYVARGVRSYRWDLVAWAQGWGMWLGDGRAGPDTTAGSLAPDPGRRHAGQADSRFPRHSSAQATVHGPGRGRAGGLPQGPASGGAGGSHAHAGPNGGKIMISYSSPACVQFQDGIPARTAAAWPVRTSAPSVSACAHAAFM